MEIRTRLTFNSEQQQAIDHRGTPLRIIAGAGTGKTATLTARFASLVERGEADIGEVLALTFTHKAASEMKERIAEQLDRSYTEFWVETFHAFCKRVLRIEHALQGQSPPRILTGQARLAFFQAAIDGHDFPTYGSRLDDFERQALRFIDRAKDELLTTDDAHALAEQRNNAQLRDLARAYDLYQQRLRRHSTYYDWGELQSRLIETFNDPVVLDRWQSKFRHILVDEYQDINQAQCTLIEMLAGDGRNLTVVGDVDQSIYAFRGASHRLLAELEERHPETKTIHLTSNFRSHQSILDTGNALIRLNPDGHGRQQLTAHDARVGVVPSVLEARDEQEEADAIARQVARLHLIEHVPLGNIAVLLRSVQVSAGPIEQALASYGLRSTFSGDLESTGEATADVLAVLRLIDGADGGDIIRVLSCQGIEPMQLLSAEIESEEDEDQLLEQLSRFDPEIGRIAGRTMASIQALGAVSLPEQVYQAAVMCGRLPLGVTISRDDYRFVQSLRSLIERAKEVAESGGSREDFVREITTGPPVADDDSHDGTAVQIMTIHAAKGLEFEHVFVANLGHGRFPLRRRLDRGLDLNQPESLHMDSLDELANDAERKRRFLEEERRLGYVALTRAIDFLYLSHARSYGGSASARSVFLSDIEQSGNELLNRVNLSPVEEGAWNAAELARSQLQQIESALDNPLLSGDAIGDLLLAQWTLAELPGASTWRSRTAPFPHDGSESLRLSYSGLQTYETCPRRYYYSHVLRLPDDSTSAYMLRGNILHSAIQWTNLQRKDGCFPSWEQLHGHLDSTWSSIGFDSPAQEQQIRRHCEHLLKRFHAFEKDQEREILGVELSLNASLGAHTLTGRIDCVARRPDGTVEIIDYKSGKSAPTKKQQKQQLGMYQLAFSQHNTSEYPRAVIYLLGNEGDKAGAFAAEFDPSKQIKSLDFDQQTLDDVTEQVLDAAGRILRNEFPTATNPNTCAGCAYRYVCEGASEDV